MPVVWPAGNHVLRAEHQREMTEAEDNTSRGKRKDARSESERNGCDEKERRPGHEQRTRATAVGGAAERYRKEDGDDGERRGDKTNLSWPGA